MIITSIYKVNQYVKQKVLVGVTVTKAPKQDWYIIVMEKL